MLTTVEPALLVVVKTTPVLLPEEVLLPEPEVALVEFPLPETPVPVLPPDTAVKAVDAVKTVELGTVVAPVETTAVPLTVDTADAVAVTALVPPLIAAIEDS